MWLAITPLMKKKIKLIKTPLLNIILRKKLAILGNKHILYLYDDNMWKWLFS